MGELNGAKELEFWGASLRGRDEKGGWLYSAATRSAIAQDVDAEFQSAKRGQTRSRQPTDLNETMMRFLHVESCFASLAVKGAVEYFGGDALTDGYFAALSEEEQAVFSKIVEDGRDELRSLCEWVFVKRRPVHQYRRDRIYVHLATLGYTRHGFGELLRKRIDAVKAEIEGRTFEEKPALKTG